MSDKEKVKELKVKLFTRYGNLATEKISETELIQKQSIGYRVIRYR